MTERERIERLQEMLAAARAQPGASEPPVALPAPTSSSLERPHVR